MLFATISFLCFTLLVIAWALLPASAATSTTAEIEEIEIAGSEMAA